MHINRYVAALDWIPLSITFDVPLSVGEVGSPQMFPAESMVTSNDSTLVRLTVRLVLSRPCQPGLP